MTIIDILRSRTDAVPTESPGTDMLGKYWTQQPITVLDDLIQLLTDDGHEDLARTLHHEILLPLDERLHAQDVR